MATTSQFELFCQGYFARLRASTGKIASNHDTAKARNKTLKKSKSARVHTVIGKSIKSVGPDVIASPLLDLAVVKAFQSVPKPSGRVEDNEYHFLMLGNSPGYKMSSYFKVPGNGGSIHYGCQLGYQLDWNDVVAAAHTHPLYKDRTVNRKNKYFSAGDPSVILVHQIPLYLRTPKAKQIKVLEIRGNWITTRRADIVGDQAKKWKFRS